MFPLTKGPWVHLLVHLPYLFIIFFSFTLRVTQIATATLFYSFNLSATDFLFCFYYFFIYFNGASSDNDFRNRKSRQG